MATSDYRIVGRFGERHRIFLFPKADGKWTAYLRAVGTQRYEHLGRYDTLDEAKDKSVIAANAFLAAQGLPTITASPEWARTRRHAPLIRRQKTFWQQILPITIGVAGLAGALGGIWFVRPLPLGGFRHDDLLATELRFQTNQLQAELALLKLELAKTPPQNQIGTALADLRNEVKTVNERISGFQAALGDDPSRRLAVPLLRKDLDVLKEEHKNDLAALQSEISRTFDFMKWLLGLIGLGSLASGVSNILSRNKSA